MTTSGDAVPQPGRAVGPTSEFSLFFRVKSGEAESLRAALGDLQETPGYRPGDYGMAISTIHEARPAGESVRPTPSVCGFVPWIC